MERCDHRLVISVQFIWELKINMTHSDILRDQNCSHWISMRSLKMSATIVLRLYGDKRRTEYIDCSMVAIHVEQLIFWNNVNSIILITLSSRGRWATYPNSLHNYVWQWIKDFLGLLIICFVNVVHSIKSK